MPGPIPVTHAHTVSGPRGSAAQQHVERVSAERDSQAQKEMVGFRVHQVFVVLVPDGLTKIRKATPLEE